MHNRRSIRLKGYDYTKSGAYFVTLCTHQRLCIFGSINDGKMVLNEWGMIVHEEWEQTAVLRSYIELDAFVVMPNHVHGILIIHNHAPTSPDQGHEREFSKPIAHSLPTIVGAWKAAATRRINRLPDPPDHPIWQRNYYEHIIRHEKGLNAIRGYIANNPARWVEDSLFGERF